MNQVELITHQFSGTNFMRHSWATPGASTTPGASGKHRVFRPRATEMDGFSDMYEILSHVFEANENEVENYSI